MRGFLAGSFALIVLYVAVQAGTAGKVESASRLSLSGLRHALSPDVAGIPDRTKSKPAAPPDRAGGGGSIIRPLGT